jgi:hypothetical protein
MTGLYYAYDLSRSSLVHKSVSRYGYSKSGEWTGRYEGTGSPRTRRDVVHPEVVTVVVAEKTLAVPVAQDQFSTVTVFEVAEVSGEVVVASKGHDIAFETRGCPSWELRKRVKGGK